MWSGRIAYNLEIIPRHFHLGLCLPGEFPDPVPGQFVMVRPAMGIGPLLSRPLSIYQFKRMESHVIMELLYRVAGQGTELLSQMNNEAVLKVLGPLGNGFNIKKGINNHILLAGGMGLAPITFLADYLERRFGGKTRLTLCIGAKNCENLIGLARIEKIDALLNICTDDGTLGACGLVTDFLPEALREGDARKTMIYACGPMTMLKALARLLETDDVPCQAAIEERMACGVGACLGCAVPVQNRRGDIFAKSVCKDGPVFDIHELSWERL